jgi:hypothetical protein
MQSLSDNDLTSILGLENILDESYEIGVIILNDERQAKLARLTKPDQIPGDFLQCVPGRRNRDNQ